jgi:H+/Cl- antiporter ClcA
MKQRLFKVFSVIPQTLRPLVGGFACAVAALIGSPQSLAVGYGTLNRILSGDLHNPVLLAKFMVTHLIMWWNEI